MRFKCPKCPKTLFLILLILNVGQLIVLGRGGKVCPTHFAEVGDECFGFEPDIEDVEFHRCVDGYLCNISLTGTYTNVLRYNVIGIPPNRVCGEIDHIDGSVSVFPGENKWQCNVNDDTSSECKLLLGVGNRRNKATTIEGVRMCGCIGSHPKTCKAASDFTIPLGKVGVQECITNAHCLHKSLASCANGKCQNFMNVAATGAMKLYQCLLGQNCDVQSLATRAFAEGLKVVPISSTQLSTGVCGDVTSTILNPDYFNENALPCVLDINGDGLCDVHLGMPKVAGLNKICGCNGSDRGGNGRPCDQIEDFDIDLGAVEVRECIVDADCTNGGVCAASECVVDNKEPQLKYVVMNGAKVKHDAFNLVVPPVVKASLVFSESIQYSPMGGKVTLYQLSKTINASYQLIDDTMTRSIVSDMTTLISVVVTEDEVEQATPGTSASITNNEVTLKFPSLPEGTYMMFVESAIVTDTSGNANLATTTGISFIVSQNAGCPSLSISGFNVPGVMLNGMYSFYKVVNGLPAWRKKGKGIELILYSHPSSKSSGSSDEAATWVIGTMADSSRFVAFLSEPDSSIAPYLPSGGGWKPWGGLIQQYAHSHPTWPLPELTVDEGGWYMDSDVKVTCEVYEGIPQVVRVGQSPTGISPGEGTRVTIHFDRPINYGHWANVKVTERGISSDPILKMVAEVERDTHLRVSGDKLDVFWGSDLSYGTSYKLEIDSGAITDLNYKPNRPFQWEFDTWGRACASYMRLPIRTRDGSSPTGDPELANSANRNMVLVNIDLSKSLTGHIQNEQSASPVIPHGTIYEIQCAPGYYPFGVADGIDSATTNVYTENADLSPQQLFEQSTDTLFPQCVDGSWTFGDVWCHMGCPPYGSYDGVTSNNNFTVDYSGSGDRRSGDTATVKCSGNTISGPLKGVTTTCYDGYWSTVNLGCEKTCGTFPDLGKSYRVDMETINSSVTATISCAPTASHVSGPKSISIPCTTTGIWNTSINGSSYLDGMVCTTSCPSIELESTFSLISPRVHLPFQKVDEGSHGDYYPVMCSKGFEVSSMSQILHSEYVNSVLRGWFGGDLDHLDHSVMACVDGEWTMTSQLTCVKGCPTLDLGSGYVLTQIDDGRSGGSINAAFSARCASDAIRSTPGSAPATVRCMDGLWTWDSVELVCLSSCKEPASYFGSQYTVLDALGEVIPSSQDSGVAITSRTYPHQHRGFSVSCAMGTQPIAATTMLSIQGAYEPPLEKLYLQSASLYNPPSSAPYNAEGWSDFHSIANIDQYAAAAQPTPNTVASLICDDGKWMTGHSTVLRCINYCEPPTYALSDIFSSNIRSGSRSAKSGWGAQLEYKCPKGGPGWLYVDESYQLKFHPYKSNTGQISLRCLGGEWVGNAPPPDVLTYWDTMNRVAAVAEYQTSNGDDIIPYPYRATGVASRARTGMESGMSPTLLAYNTTASTAEGLRTMVPCNNACTYQSLTSHLKSLGIEAESPKLATLESQSQSNLDNPGFLTHGTIVTVKCADSRKSQIALSNQIACSDGDWTIPKMLCGWEGSLEDPKEELGTPCVLADESVMYLMVKGKTTIPMTNGSYLSHQAMVYTFQHEILNLPHSFNAHVVNGFICSNGRMVHVGTLYNEDGVVGGVTEAAYRPSHSSTILNAAPNCSNRQLDRGEHSVDCGGTCNPCPDCQNGLLDFATEEWIDCGRTCAKSCDSCVNMWNYGTSIMQWDVTVDVKDTGADVTFVKQTGDATSQRRFPHFSGVRTSCEGSTVAAGTEGSYVCLNGDWYSADNRDSHFIPATNAPIAVGLLCDIGDVSLTDLKGSGSLDGGVNNDIVGLFVDFIDSDCGNLAINQPHVFCSSDCRSDLYRLEQKVRGTQTFDARTSEIRMLVLSLIGAFCGAVDPSHTRLSLQKESMFVAPSEYCMATFSVDRALVKYGMRSGEFTPSIPDLRSVCGTDLTTRSIRLVDHGLAIGYSESCLFQNTQFLADFERLMDLDACDGVSSNVFCKREVQYAPIYLLNSAVRFSNVLCQTPRCAPVIDLLRAADVLDIDAQTRAYDCVSPVIRRLGSTLVNVSATAFNGNGFSTATGGAEYASSAFNDGSSALARVRSPILEGRLFTAGNALTRRRSLTPAEVATITNPIGLWEGVLMMFIGQYFGEEDVSRTNCMAHIAQMADVLGGNTRTRSSFNDNEDANGHMLGLLPSTCPTHCRSLIGDGRCDVECFNPECLYDAGDCQFSAVYEPVWNRLVDLASEAIELNRSDCCAFVAADITKAILRIERALPLYSNTKSDGFVREIRQLLIKTDNKGSIALADATSRANGDDLGYLYVSPLNIKPLLSATSLQYHSAVGCTSSTRSGSSTGSRATTVHLYQPLVKQIAASPPIERCPNRCSVDTVSIDIDVSEAINGADLYSIAFWLSGCKSLTGLNNGSICNPRILPTHTLLKEVSEETLDLVRLGVERTARSNTHIDITDPTYALMVDIADLVSTYLHIPSEEVSGVLIHPNGQVIVRVSAQSVDEFVDLDPLGWLVGDRVSGWLNGKPMGLVTGGRMLAGMDGFQMPMEDSDEARSNLSSSSQKQQFSVALPMTRSLARVKRSSRGDFGGCSTSMLDGTTPFSNYSTKRVPSGAPYEELEISCASGFVPASSLSTKTSSPLVQRNDISLTSTVVCLNGEWVHDDSAGHRIRCSKACDGGLLPTDSAAAMFNIGVDPATVQYDLTQRSSSQVNLPVSSMIDTPSNYIFGDRTTAVVSCGADFAPNSQRFECLNGIWAPNDLDLDCQRIPDALSCGPINAKLFEQFNMTLTDTSTWNLLLVQCNRGYRGITDATEDDESKNVSLVMACDEDSPIQVGRDEYDEHGKPLTVPSLRVFEYSLLAAASAVKTSTTINIEDPLNDLFISQIDQSDGVLTLKNVANPVCHTSIVEPSTFLAIAAKSQLSATAMSSSQSNHLTLPLRNGVWIDESEALRHLSLRCEVQVLRDPNFLESTGIDDWVYIGIVGGIAFGFTAIFGAFGYWYQTRGRQQKQMRRAKKLLSEWEGRQQQHSSDVQSYVHSDPEVFTIPRGSVA